MLNKALAAIEDENPSLNGVLKNNIKFNETKGKVKIVDSTWKELLDHFNNPHFVLINDNFEFPDLLGAAYEYLIKQFADSAGKKGGEFYTPSEVVRLLVQITKPQEGNTIYDPTVGSGGFLIQSYQYVEEQGQDKNNLHLYGQDSNGTVWSICHMNLILHNITNFTIENGDTLENPLIFENNQIKKFDRVLANPPFSQNYSRKNMNFTNRFSEWCPENGKKADLMFVQHMLASLKQNGHMATIMPHGVLFRGGKEKLIREKFIENDVIEAIISLPPNLFYGTGIPACVLVCNKNKPDNLLDKILFINADHEYAEGKNQNRLRPEDIEKIDFVFTNKLEIPKYSRLVSKSEIVETHDFNLNIRRYVDNTPEPEPEDVTAHLIGGVPAKEVLALESYFQRFGVQSSSLFSPFRSGYLTFCSEIETKAAIKSFLENDKAVLQTINNHHQALETWWTVANDEFANLRHSNNGGKKMPEVRLELINTLKNKLTPLKVLDEFKSAGVFVNWWQQIRYDLKTIVFTGWHHTLIPDEYLVNEFFEKESKEITSLDAKLGHLQGELDEAIGEAQEIVSYESEGDLKPSVNDIKKELRALIEDLQNSDNISATKELYVLKKQEEIIKSIESRIKDTKTALKQKTDLLELKIQLKRLGGEEFKAEKEELIRQIDDQLTNLDADSKADKKKINALNKDKLTIQEQITKTNALMTEIGGQLTEEDAKRLILKKLYDIVSRELERYLNAEKRRLIQGVENLWNKYSVSHQKLEVDRTETLEVLDGFLKGLGYL